MDQTTEPHTTRLWLKIAFALTVLGGLWVVKTHINQMESQIETKERNADTQIREAMRAEGDKRQVIYWKNVFLSSKPPLTYESGEEFRDFAGLKEWSVIFPNLSEPLKTLGYRYAIVSADEGFVVGAFAFRDSDPDVFPLQKAVNRPDDCHEIGFKGYQIRLLGQVAGQELIALDMEHEHEACDVDESQPHKWTETRIVDASLGFKPVYDSIKTKETLESWVWDESERKEPYLSYRESMTVTWDLPPTNGTSASCLHATQETSKGIKNPVTSRTELNLCWDAAAKELVAK